MAWIEPQRIPLLASGIAMLLLAILLGSIDFRKRVNRAFAAFLALRGATLILFSFDLGATGTRAVQAFFPYLSLAAVPLVLYFASLYPRRRGPLSRDGMGWAVLAAIVVLDGTYLLWHEGYQTLAPGPAPTSIQFVGPDLHVSEFGPLAFVGALLFPLMAALGVLFVADYIRSPEGTQRVSYFLVAAGFLVNGIFDGSRQLVGFVRLMQDGSDAFPWLPWGWPVVILPVLSLLPAMAGLILIGVHHFKGREEERRRERRRERLLFAMAALAALAGLLSLFLPRGSEFFEHPAPLILLGVLRLSLPLFVSYALLRYALFDIDLKVRAAVAWTFVVVVFGAVYFIVSETLEGQVSERYGSLGGLGAAALLTVAGGPLAALGRRVAKALMPGVKELEAVAPKAGEEIYRQQFLMLQEDGTLTAKERRSLDELRRHLGLAPARTTAIERTALRAPARGSAGA
ncbi:MAG: hypothetical protein ACYC2H_08790 [Thermoplasmatota archaeon]